MTSHYIDITLLPDPEFSHAHLLGALVTKHRALVQLGSADIGISFPGYSLRPRTLGTILRLHGSEAALRCLMEQPWLQGMRDHVHCTLPALVPEGAVPCLVQRRQFKTSPDRLRRRRMRRNRRTGCGRHPRQRGAHPGPALRSTAQRQHRPAVLPVRGAESGAGHGGPGRLQHLRAEPGNCCSLVLTLFWRPVGSPFKSTTWRRLGILGCFRVRGESSLKSMNWEDFCLVRCRIGSSEMLVDAVTELARVRCRIGSSEIPWPGLRWLQRVRCRIGSSESCGSRCPPPSHVRCRIGSSESIGDMSPSAHLVRCRIGSSEKEQKQEQKSIDVRCRIGSSEMLRLQWMPTRRVRCRIGSSETG